MAIAVFNFFHFNLMLKSKSPDKGVDNPAKDSKNLMWADSHQKLLYYIENSPLGMIEVDTNHNILQWSGKAEKIFGWKASEVIGKDLTALHIVHEEDNAAVRKRINKLSVMERTGISSNRNYTRDGKIIECNWYNSVILDHSGSVTSILSLIDDVTEQKHAERKLMESEEKFRLLFEQMCEGFCVLEAVDEKNGKPSDFKLISCNPAFEKHTGIKPELGKYASENIPRNEKYWIDALIETAATRQVVEYENYSPSRKKYIRTISFYYKTGFIAVIVEDISERKIAEKELYKSRKKLEIALETGHIGTWEWDLKSKIVTWDERMEKIFGFKKGKFGKTYEEFENCINEEDLDHFRKSLSQTLKKEIPFETAFRNKQAKGQSHYIATKAILIKNKNGKPVSLIGVCLDISGMQKGAENLLLKLNEELLRSNKELEQFAYVASHDLQEPLRMVSSFTQLLAQRYEYKLDEDGKEYIRYAVEGSKRMYDLINGLLAYSRIQMKGGEFKMVNMNRVVEHAARNLNLFFQEKNIYLVSKDLPLIMADEGQMIQLIQNLLSNSIKFSPSGSKITISSKSENKDDLIMIRDEGIGIEPQYFEKIFKIFQQLEPSRYKGTGIGLAVCKRIVERHGGRIWVESEAGKGSVFQFTVPKTEALENHF